MDINVQVLDKWPEKPTMRRRAAPFRGTQWTRTQYLLEGELRKIGAKNVTLHTFHSSQDIRMDGKIRADSRAPAHPGVILTFEKYGGFDTASGQSKSVTMRLPCDTFLQWKDNVRAIALALEALRKIDRYGVMTGAQYAGYKALGPGDVGVNGMTPELAAQFIADSAGMGNVAGVASSILKIEVFAESVFKTAAKLKHPDKEGGNAEEFKKLEGAMRIVRALRNETSDSGPPIAKA